MSSIYTTGEYWEKHPDWHLADSAAKALDIRDAMLAALDESSDPIFCIADIGTGIGGVLGEVVKILSAQRPQRKLKPVGFELSSAATNAARAAFPNIEFRNKAFEPRDAPFNVVMLIDVIEHLENPCEMLRATRQAAQYLVVRQPLLESFSTFRHANYGPQREEWGHIAYFNYHSFLDMARATGWQPLRISLVPPWELGMHQGRKPVLPRLLNAVSPIMASHFTSGYYLNGVFKHATENK